MFGRDGLDQAGDLAASGHRGPQEVGVAGGVEGGGGGLPGGQGLAQAGADVTVLMTTPATRFVTPLTFQALSGNPVYTTMWEHVESKDPQHIALADRTEVALVAPCTMDFAASLAFGRANNVVSLVLSAIDRTQTPVVLAPSMNEVMWNQPATRRNFAQLGEDGFSMVDPGSGW